MNHILKNWLKIILLLSIIAISTALIAEYFFNLAPCKMCLKQRHPYYGIISLVIIFYFINFHKNIWLFITNQILILYGLYYSTWHVGIEQKILSGPESCSGKLTKTNSFQNLKEQINNQEIVSCSEISWSILGFSAAFINTLLLLFFLFFNSIYIYKYFYGSEKKN